MASQVIEIFVREILETRYRPEMQLLRRILISLVGGTVLLIGIAMIFLPLPSIIVIPAGLAILALEYAWARHWLNKFRALLPGKKAMPAPDYNTVPSDGPK